MAPFIIGGAIGVPIGTMLLTSINPEYLRTGVGVPLVLYSIYGLAQPAFKPIKAGVAADASIGVLNGLFAGVTGLPGLIVTIWSQLRGWPKDVQRTVFQPVMLAAIVVNAVALSLAGAVTAETVNYFLGLRCCWPACGADSNCMENSTMQRSARSSCCFCWCPGLR